MTSCHFDGSNFDLALNSKSQQDLRQVFEELSLKILGSSTLNSLKDVTHLYLNNNRIKNVSILDLVDIFPRLKWLDLRNNKLKSLEGPGSPRRRPDGEIKSERFLKIQVRI